MLVSGAADLKKNLKEKPLCVAPCRRPGASTASAAERPRLECGPRVGLGDRRMGEGAPLRRSTPLPDFLPNPSRFLSRNSSGVWKEEGRPCLLLPNPSGSLSCYLGSSRNGISP